MRFIKQPRLISNLGILLLVNSFPAIGLAKMPELPAQVKMGGIPTLCHLERIKTISESDKQFSAIDRLFDRYQRAKQDQLTLQLLKGMDQKQFPQLQAEELMQVAYRTPEPEEAVPLFSQAFQLLQSVNDDKSSTSNSYQYIWRTLRYHSSKERLLENIVWNFIYLKQPDLAEAALLQGLHVMEQQPRLSSKDKVESTVKIARGFLSLGKKERTIALLDKSLEITQPLNLTKYNRDSKDWLILLSNLSWEYRIVGETRKADLLFNKSLDYATSFGDPARRIWWLSILAETTYSPYELIPTSERQAKLKQIFSRILQIARSTDTTKTYPNTSLIAAEWLQFSGIEPAMQIANTVADPVERFKVLSSILLSIRSENANKDLNLLLPLLTNAEAIVSTIQPTADRDKAWNVIATTYAKLGQSQTALQAIAQIQSAEEKQHTLIEVAGFLAQANQPDLALGLVKGLPDTLVQQVLYNAMLAYLKNEQLEKALGLQGRLSKDYQNSALTDLAETSAKVGDPAQALMLLKQINETSRRSSSFVKIVEQAVEVGDLDRAVVFAQQMPLTKSSEYDSASKSWVLEEIAIAYAESSQYDKALQLSQSLLDPSLSQLVICAKRTQNF